MKTLKTIIASVSIACLLVTSAVACVPDIDPNACLGSDPTGYTGNWDGGNDWWAVTATAFLLGVCFYSVACEFIGSPAGSMRSRCMLIAWKGSRGRFQALQRARERLGEGSLD